MQIHVHVNGFALTDALDPHARYRLHFVFDRLPDAASARVPVSATSRDSAEDPR